MRRTEWTIPLLEVRIEKVNILSLFFSTSEGCNDRSAECRLKRPHQNAKGNTTQRWSCHLSRAFGEKGWYKARVLEQKELGQHEMAHKVVRFAAEHAILF